MLPIKIYDIISLSVDDNISGGMKYANYYFRKL